MKTMNPHTVSQLFIAVKAGATNPVDHCFCGFFLKKSLDSIGAKCEVGKIPTIKAISDAISHAEKLGIITSAPTRSEYPHYRMTLFGKVLFRNWDAVEKTKRVPVIEEVFREHQKARSGEDNYYADFYKVSESTYEDNHPD